MNNTVRITNGRKVAEVAASSVDAWARHGWFPVEESAQEPAPAVEDATGDQAALDLDDADEDADEDADGEANVNDED